MDCQTIIPGGRTKLAHVSRYMTRPLRACVLTGAFASLVAPPILSQAPQAPAFSIGQPPIWRQHVAVQGTAYRSSKAGGATISYGVFRPFSKPPSNAFNPLLGIIGATVEGYGSVGQFGDAGVRALLTSQMFATSVG